MTALFAADVAGADAVPFAVGDRVELLARATGRALGSGTVISSAPFRIAVDHDGAGLTMVAGPCDLIFELRPADAV